MVKEAHLKSLKKNKNEELLKKATALENKLKPSNS